MSTTEPETLQDEPTAKDQADLAEALAMLQQQEATTVEPSPADPPPGPHSNNILSPTLAGLPENRRPTVSTACDSCPNAVWFASSAEVKCYCRVMYLITWSNKEPNVLLDCDGKYLGDD